MPNLLQIRSLREKYSAKSDVNVKDIELLCESFNMSRIELKNFFIRNNGDLDLIEYFESQKSADVVLLFIDITNFSQGCANFENNELSEYLDDYYNSVISRIYQHGGEIEKIIGDGVICVFGEPFLNGGIRDLFEKADACAKDIIVDMKDSNKEVKIALHSGKIMYYKNKTENYPEYTIIGKPLTELFRLENISENNSINYFGNSQYRYMQVAKDGMYKDSKSIMLSSWENSDVKKVDLKGVEHQYVLSFTCKFKNTIGWL